MRRPLSFATLVLLGVVADHTTKFLVFRSLRDNETIELVPGWLQIKRAINHGVAFSFLQNQPWIILCVSFIALGAITYIYLRSWRTAHVTMIWALGLLLVGAVGNLLDRLAFRYVRDFIDFVPPLPLVGRWAVFNVADICVTVGVILFLIAEVFLKEQSAVPPASKPPQGAPIPETPGEGQGSLRSRL
jgi:signal peptidase II